ncbi:hypothetical protein, partial [Romboutsia sp.]|uniref:hypothetical protein n=1 Tax=Romboutsia sp. TaxID=1965302 RepID=UPI003F3C7E56
FPKQNRIFLDDYTNKELCSYVVASGKTPKPISLNTLKKDVKNLISENVVSLDFDDMGEFTDRILIYNEIPEGHFKMKFSSTTIDYLTTNIPSDELRVFLYLANFKEGLNKKGKDNVLNVNSSTIYNYCFGEYGAVKEGIEPTSENIKKKQKSDSKKVYNIINSLEAKGYLKTISPNIKGKTVTSIFKVIGITYPKVDGRDVRNIKNSKNMSELKPNVI